MVYNESLCVTGTWGKKTQQKALECDSSPPFWKAWPRAIETKGGTEGGLGGGHKEWRRDGDRGWQRAGRKVGRQYRWRFGQRTTDRFQGGDDGGRSHGGNRRSQGGSDGRRSQDGDRSSQGRSDGGRSQEEDRREQEEPGWTQTPARMAAPHRWWAEGELRGCQDTVEAKVRTGVEEVGEGGWAGVQDDQGG